MKAIKLAKLGKSVRLLRRTLTLSGAGSLALGVVALALALAAPMVGYMLTGDAPLEGGARAVALVVAGMLATFGVKFTCTASGPPVRRKPGSRPGFRSGGRRR